MTLPTLWKPSSATAFAPKYGRRSRNDLGGFTAILRDNLADFAVPKFLRISSELPTTGTMKVIKGPLKREGFDRERIRDPLYVLLPGESEFTALTKEIYENIGEGK